jgi:hypothetical protein
MFFICFINFFQKILHRHKIPLFKVPQRLWNILKGKNRGQLKKYEKSFEEINKINKNLLYIQSNFF